MRRAYALSRLPVLASVAAAIALLAAPGRAELVLDVYVLVLGAILLGYLLAGVRRSTPRVTSSPFERALRPPPGRRERLADLERLERELALAAQTAADLHFRFRPRLRRIAGRLLLARRGIDLDGDPEAARAALGDELWELVRPDREAPRRRDDPGLSVPAAERVVAALERL